MTDTTIDFTSYYDRIDKWEKLGEEKERIKNYYHDNCPLLPLNHIFDPNQSKDWNITQAIKYNRDHSSEDEEVWNEKRRLEKEWKNSIVAFIQSSTNIPFNDLQAELIWNYVSVMTRNKEWDWEDDVLAYLDDFLEEFSRIFHFGKAWTSFEDMISTEKELLPYDEQMERWEELGREWERIHYRQEHSINFVKNGDNAYSYFNDEDKKLRLHWDHSGAEFIQQITIIPFSDFQAMLLWMHVSNAIEHRPNYSWSMFFEDLKLLLTQLEQIAYVGCNK